MRQRPTRSFLRGCIAGCLATFFFYTLLRFTEQDANRGVGSTACVQTVTFNGDSKEGRFITIENQLIGSSDNNNGEHSGFSSISDAMMSLVHLVGNVLSLGEEYYTTSDISSSFQTKKSLLIVITTTQKKLQTTAALMSTILHHPTIHYRILVGGKQLDPSLIEFVQTTDNVYHASQCYEFVPSLNSFSMWCLLDAVHSRYGHSYQWFLLATSQTYVAGGELQQLLAQLDPSDNIYMGHPSEVEVKNHQQLLYCEQGPGIIFSESALTNIQPYLRQCMYGRPYGDIALGKCFARNLKTQCKKSSKSSKLFINDVDSLSLHPEKLWYDHTLQDLLTLYPVRNPAHMFSIDLYCKHREANKLHRHARYLDKHANLVCQHVPNKLRPPLTQMDARLCRMDGDIIYNYSTISTSNLNLTTKDLPEKFYPKHRYEVVPWKTLSSQWGYTLGSEIPMTKISGEFRQEVDHVIQEATQYVEDTELEDLTFRSLTNGYVRYSGLQGREYILDLLLRNSRNEELARRVHLIRPHLPSLVAMDNSGHNVLTRQVNFIVPLSHVTERFSEFLKMYETLCLVLEENCNLVLSVYGDQEYKNVQTSVQGYTNKYPDFHPTILKGSGLFTRARALHLGLSHLKDDDLAFLCDVDMTINQGFLNRCRQNTVRHSRVYYPTFFKYYDMDYVYKFKKKPSTFPIARQHGHWAAYSYGMVCIYKSDYDSIGGFNTEIEGWGEEDVDLFQKVVDRRLDVMRSADPALFHRYHDKVCSTKLDPTQFKHCISSREEDIADRMQLAEYVFYLEDQLEIRKRKLWS